MKEILDDIYQHCLGMQKLAERKNVGIIGFNIIVSLTTIYLLQTGLQSYLQYYLLFVLACSIISISRVCSAISAQLKQKKSVLLTRLIRIFYFSDPLQNMHLKITSMSFTSCMEITKILRISREIVPARSLCSHRLH